jgi:hypothetical protein
VNFINIGRIFVLQKRIIRTKVGVGSRCSCRSLFKKIDILHILPVPYISKASNPITGLERPLGAQEVEVRLSALRTGRLSWYSFLLEAEWTPGP